MTSKKLVGNLELNSIYNDDCLKLMSEIPDESIDLVLADPPYGTTGESWDNIIPLDELWSHLLRITKDNSAIVMTASQPFTSILVSSMIDLFKHEWIWFKNVGSNFATIKYHPFKQRESVIVFSKNTVNYYPVMEEKKPSSKARSKYSFSSSGGNKSIGRIDSDKRRRIDINNRYPCSVQKFKRESGLHPNQKPIKLMEYLINTYSLPDEVVLDFSAGSGSTGIACQNTKRNYILIENDLEIFKKAETRLKLHNRKVAKRLLW